MRGRRQASRSDLPGFENLSGSIDIADGAGTIQLASKDATLILPGVLAEPRVKLAKLDASVRWKSDPALEVRVESAAASNADIELEAAGLIARPNGDKGGPGWLDLTGRIARLHAPAAYRYVPLAAGNTTLDWLQHALVAGRVTRWHGACQRRSSRSFHSRGSAMRSFASPHA